MLIATISFQCHIYVRFLNYFNNNIRLKIVLTLEFKTFGEPIKNKEMVFEKNYRENEAKRGLGLGLNMVKGICEKYGIRYSTTYLNNQNIFRYTF